jgi:hypothetical protein
MTAHAAAALTVLCVLVAGCGHIVGAGSSRPASVGIGYQATHTGNTANPTGFALNGVGCAAG